MDSLLNKVNQNDAPLSQINTVNVQSGFRGAISLFSITELSIFNIYRTLFLEVGVLYCELKLLTLFKKTLTIEACSAPISSKLDIVFIIDIKFIQPS